MNTLKAIVVLFVCVEGTCCFTESASDQREKERGIVAVLQQIQIESRPNSRSRVAHLEFQLHNQSGKTWCILPSEMQYSYFILLEDDVICTDTRAKATIDTTARKVSDLELKSVVLAPKQKVTLQMVGGVPDGLKEGSGAFKLTLRCSPVYEGDTYRGVSIYRKAMESTTRVIVERRGSTAWIVRPIESAGQEKPDEANTRRTDAGTRVAQVLEPVWRSHGRSCSAIQSNQSSRQPAVAPNISVQNANINRTNVLQGVCWSMERLQVTSWDFVPPVQEPGPPADSAVDTGTG